MTCPMSVKNGIDAALVWKYSWLHTAAIIWQNQTFTNCTMFLICIMWFSDRLFQTLRHILHRFLSWAAEFPAHSPSFDVFSDVFGFFFFVAETLECNWGGVEDIISRSRSEEITQAEFHLQSLHCIYDDHQLYREMECFDCINGDGDIRCEYFIGK